MMGLGYFKEKAEQRRETARDQEQIQAEAQKLTAALAQDEKALLRLRYGEFLTECPLEKNTILYESFGGRGMICSPFAIFKYLMSQKKYGRYEHVWVIDDFGDNREQIARYQGFGNVRFVQYQSEEYVKALATAKYLINNVSFPGYFVKRRGQVYLNTWHGVPMKTMGFDIPGGNISSGNSARNLLTADYLISTGPYMTEKAYLESYKLKGIYEGTILENGFPRNDVFFHSDRKEIIETMRRQGVDIDPDKKVILYAPTWKGEKYSRPETSLDEYFRLMETIEAAVDTSKYQVLVKPHQIVYYHIKNTRGVTGKFIPAVLDTNEILSVTDVLISDYSSIHFDFLVSGKPLVFFIPDLDEFSDYRGLYFGLDRLPGPVIRTYEELGNLFREPEKISDGYREKYEAERSWACPRDDGEVCRRTADALLHGKKSGVSVKCSDADKKKLLVYGGKFSDNDRTETFMSLMNNIDYNKFDITVLAEAVTEEGSRRLNELNPGARVLYWKPFYAASGKELARHSLLEQAKEESTICTPYEFYRREKIRAAGDARFDGVLDFAGDSAVFHRMTEQMKGILQVSLVEGTGFRCSMPVNLERIRAEEKQQRVLETEKGREYIASIREMEDGSQEVETVALPDQDTYNFVTLGSLTQENHYEKLIQCFAELGDRKKLHLYILGDGPRKGKLEALVKEKGLESRVSFLGYLQYPLGFIAQCSCFALESESGDQNPWILWGKALGLAAASSYQELGWVMEKPRPPFEPEAYNRQCREELEALFR